MVSGRFTIGGASLAASFIVLLVLDYFSSFIHELGHAVVLVHNGRRIKSAGFMIYFGSPAFFVESSDGLMMDRRQQIAAVVRRAVRARLVLAGIASLIVWWFPEWFLSRDAVHVRGCLNYFVIIMNLIPLLELDGYYILADVIQVPDLRAAIARVHPRRPVPQAPDIGSASPSRTSGSPCTAILGIAFTIFSLYRSYYYWQTVFGDARRAGCGTEGP